MKPNQNFHNEYFALIDVTNREKALRLIKKISDEKPGLLQEAKFRFTDCINGDLRIQFDNTSAFDTDTKRVILIFINSIRNHKNC